MSNHNDFQENHVSNEMVCSIASVTAAGVDGVDKMFMRLSDELKDTIYPSAVAQGVKVVEKEIGYFIDLHFITRANGDIPKICHEVQKQVKASVEDMTHKKVIQVNVKVMGSGKY